MKPIRVTFDSNVWEKVVFPDKFPVDPNHIFLPKIKDALQKGRLQGFICETVGTLEAIKRKERANYFANKKPKSEVQIEGTGSSRSVTITFKTDHDLHPGLPQILIDRLQEARTIGIRLLPIPRLNLPLPGQFLNDSTFYAPEAFSSGAYFDRFGEVALAIEARGVGGAVIDEIAKRIEKRLPANAQTSNGGAQLLIHAKDEAERAEIANAIAEWADADLVASHIGIENELLCTEDQGKSARGPSIFDATNRAWLSATYRVKFVTVQELAALLSK